MLRSLFLVCCLSSIACGSSASEDADQNAGAMVDYGPEPDISSIVGKTLTFYAEYRIPAGTSSLSVHSTTVDGETLECAIVVAATMDQAGILRRNEVYTVSAALPNEANSVHAVTLTLKESDGVPSNFGLVCLGLDRPLSVYNVMIGLGPSFALK